MWGFGFILDGFVNRYTCGIYNFGGSMKLVYKGVFKDNERLPKGVLPQNAVKFVEPNSMGKVILAASVFIIPALLMVGLFLTVHYLLYGEAATDLTSTGLIAALFCMVPHELLHGVCFGKDADVEMYVAPKQLSMFVISTQPVTKARFIFLSLLPNLIFGWIPLFFWTVLPHNEIYSDHLFAFALMSVIIGIGDYLNVFNAARQMPKGSMQQLSGMNSYWYTP
jgi:hypothetical protein